MSASKLFLKSALILFLVAGLSSVPFEVQAQQNNQPNQQNELPGWLGVKVVPVPEAVKAQLRLEEITGSYSGGVMISNIARNSPAEAAGLDRFDVIVKVNQKPVTENLKDFIRQLKATKAGDTIELTYISGGVMQTKSVTLTAPIAKHKAPYKYIRKPHRMKVETTSVRVVVMSKDDNGWTLQDFSEGDLSTLKDLPPDLLFSTQLWKERMEGAVAKARTIVTQGDRLIEVELNNDGKITVRRTFKTAISSQTETSTYDNPDELAKGDQAAYLVYEQMPVKPVKVDEKNTAVLTPEKAMEQPTYYDFEERSDGGIAVRIRKGTRTLSMQFTSAQSMKNLKPRIHDEYLKAKALESE